VSSKEKISKHDYVIKCKKAAAQGNVVAQNTLGYLYLNGQGITSDYAKAAQWFQKAAEQGYSAAQYNLSIMYKLGQGVEKNTAEALMWLKAAAHKGHTEAQVNLGNQYYQGTDCEQDYVNATMWWLIAQQNSQIDIEHQKEAAQKKMSPQQISDAQRLATAWHAKV